MALKSAFIKMRWFRCGFFLGWIALSGPALSAEAAKVVLFTGADPVQPAALVQIRTIRTVLESALPQRVEVFVESLDGFRFGDEELAPELLALVKKEYAHQHVDLVVALGTYGADFVFKHLWLGTPVLLSSVEQDWLRQRPIPPEQASFRITLMSKNP
jgi:hypothetical protein